MKPKVGMGATMRLGSDCYPYTIIWVNDKKNQAAMQSDNFIMVKGSLESESQTYEYSTNTDSRQVIISLRKNGSWRVACSQTPVSIGNRRAYRDPSF